MRWWKKKCPSKNVRILVLVVTVIGWRGKSNDYYMNEVHLLLQNLHHLHLSCSVTLKKSILWIWNLLCYQDWSPVIEFFFVSKLGSSKFLVRIQVEDQWLNRISNQYAVYMGPEKTREKPMEIVKSLGSRNIKNEQIMATHCKPEFGQPGYLKQKWKNAASESRNDDSRPRHNKKGSS